MIMKRDYILRFMSGSCALMLGGAVLGQNTNPSDPRQSAEPSLTQRPLVVPPTTAPETPNLPGRPEHLPVPGRPTPSKDMKELVRDFQTARETFRKQQMELNRQLKKATEDQRAAIRAQLQENLKQWLEEQKARTEDLRAQGRMMKDDIKGLRDVIDSGGGPKGQGPRGRP